MSDHHHHNISSGTKRDVAARDYPVIIGTTLVYAVFVVGINLVVDLSYFLLDPRVRMDRAS